MRARYYDQDIRRFINKDVVSGEITNSGSLNRYAYVQGSPVSLTDPFGLCPDSNSTFKNLCINLLNGLEAGTFDAGAFWQTIGGIGIAVLSGKGMVSSGRDLLACTGNAEKTLKGRLLDADISGMPVETGGMATYINGNSSAEFDIATVVAGVDIRSGEIYVGVKNSLIYKGNTTCAENIVFRGLGEIPMQI